MTAFEPPLPASLWPRLFEIAGGRSWPPTDAASANVLIEAAGRDDLLPILFDDDTAPAIVRDALEGSRALARLHEMRATIMATAVRQLAVPLEGEPFIVLKGAEFAYRLYPKPQHRLFRDIDLLIPRERMEPVATRLLGHGLEDADIYGADGSVTSHHERSFRQGQLTIDVHHSFIQRARHDIDYDAIWQRRVPASVAGVACFRLSDADAIFYQAFSIAIHELHVPILRYLDLQRMIAMNPAAFDEAMANARRWKARRAFYAAMRQLCILFPELGLEPRIQSLVTSAERAVIETNVIPDPTEAGRTAAPLPRLEQIRRKALIIDDAWRRGRFFAYYLWAHAAGRIRRRRSRPGVTPRTR
jgi:hypothetical protein